MAQNRLSKFPASIRVAVQALIYWWDDWIAQVVMSIVWVLAWFTIVLGPPATFGLAYAESRLIRGESLGFHGMFEGAKRYFLKSWLWMLANVVAIALTVNGILFYGQIEQVWGAVLRVVMLSILIVWVSIQFFAVPFLIIQEKETLRLAWRNSLFTIMASPGFTLVLFFIAALVIGLSVVFVIPLFLGFIPLSVTMFSQAVKERVETFKEMMKKSEIEGENAEEKQEN